MTIPSNKIIVIGAGVGGLSAALRLARLGYEVEIVEARAQAGGLAAGFAAGGFTFDAGPYILLDKPGLEWALGRLDIALGALPLVPIESVYEVLHDDGAATGFQHSLAATAAGFEARYPGSGARYASFVARTATVHRRLQPLTYFSRPGLLDVLRQGALGSVPFMLRSLGGVLGSSGLPAPLQAAVGIWTHIAGQPMAQAPAPMAFVPGLFHGVGAYLPRGGMRAIPALLLAEARAAGVQIRYESKVAAIRAPRGRVAGVVLASGEVLPAAAAVSDASGIGTYVELVEDFPAPARAQLQRLPLQSPGTCVYLAVRGRQPPYYVRFRLRSGPGSSGPGSSGPDSSGTDSSGTGGQGGCTAFVQPGLLDPELAQDGWFPARLISPLPHATAAALGAEGQHALMDQQLAEPWWQAGIGEFRVLHRRTTFEWGRDYHLYRDSMNPVMTAQLMRRGRLAHRSPHVRGLYLTGSSTHPGQWVSFCAIAGVLAADCLAQDLPHLQAHPAHA